MSKILQEAFDEAARLPEAEQDRLGRELLAEVEGLRLRRSAKQSGPRPLSPADLDWLAANRVGRTGTTDAGTLVSQMRDEDWR
jgi:hypothetical protein